MCPLVCGKAIGPPGRRHPPVRGTIDQVHPPGSTRKGPREEGTRLELLKTAIRIALLRFTELRAEGLLHLLMTAFWLGWGIAGLKIVFEYAGSLGGWSFDACLAVYGMHYLLIGWYYFAVRSGIGRLPELVADGSLDRYLVLPGPALLHLTVRNLEMGSIWDLLGGLALLAYGILRQAPALDAGTLCLALLSMACALVLATALMASVAMLGFWVRRVDPLFELTFAVLLAARYPADIYKARPVLLSPLFLLISLMTTTPVQWLLRGEGRGPLAVVVVLTVLAVLVAAALWRRGLRRYCSA